jgi:excinuclease ABC subunit A
MVGSAHPTNWLTVVGARQNNLRNIDVAIPLGRFVCVTGVSGSGKSSLVNDIIRETLARDLNGAVKVRPGDHDRIEGIEQLDKIIDIDQSPIGRTPRSNPATYIKAFDEIRALYTRLPDSKIRGYKPGRFSFNVQTGKKGGGRCEACEGNGSNRMEMDFLADVWVTCPVCTGHRFARETLQILYKQKSIADVLEMDVQEALDHFDNIPRIAKMLRTLHEVGLDYLKLGQPSNTLSGGEAQRIKLARELVKQSTGRTLYLLDEPTTGLHFADIKKLLDVLHRFVEEGNSVMVIEHNLDVVKTADWVIDLGPEGGSDGGRIVAQGTPEQIVKSKRSYTGAALRDVLNGRTSERNADPTARIIAATASYRAATVRERDSRPQKHKNVIRIVGAKQHNLKDITVDVPRGKMNVCCGPSGSGKSSFAVDTVYAEGQRRYVESLSSYARQFLNRLQPPRVDHVYGLSPSICIEQKTASKSPRSTVGTITEIYDYMRVLWARIGTPRCPKCHVPITAQTSDDIVERIMALGEGEQVLLLAPIAPSTQETFEHLFQRERANGYARIRVDGIVHALDEPIRLDAKRKHQVELVVDRVMVRKAAIARIADSVEQALSVGNGVMIAEVVSTVNQATPSNRATSSTQAATACRAATSFRAATVREREHSFSKHNSCPQCGRGYDTLTPHHFSFNSRMGWCAACEGLGVQQGAGASAIVTRPTQSIADGAIGAWGELKSGSKLHAIAEALSEHIGFNIHTPWNELTEPQRLAMLHGRGDDWINADLPAHKLKQTARGKSEGRTSPFRFRWRGFFPAISRATRASWQYRKRLEDLVTEVACDACVGGRLKPESAAAQIDGSTIHETCLRPLGETLTWFDSLQLDARQRKIAGELLHEITSRLQFLVEVGLDYVSLHRTATTLSGGESQRIQLASQIGTGLTGVLYVLDEPTIGLHPRDNHRLIGALKRLRDLGNTLMLVEHDRELIESADHIMDFGPGSGRFGGQVTAAATPKGLRSKRASLTGKYLTGKEAIPIPTNRRSMTSCDRWLTVHGARENNLKEIDVAFPLGRFTCVTGVSGSGKSSLVSSILYKALAARIHRARVVAGGHDRISGIEQVDKVINVDQSPIGNSPMSNPATYTGAFDAIRELFAKLPLSKIRGYAMNRFSFNRPGGRCEACEGMGQRCIEMHFLPDVWVECENCGGARYVPETLEVMYRNKSIADVLDMSLSEARDLFVNVPKVHKMLQTLEDVGLGYVQLGQSAPSLSAGEAQRVKLAAELGRPSTGKTLYILDEPTTGLHFDDLKKLLVVLHRLVERGNACICIEHNLDVIKTADWVIDLGPEAGAAGGTIVVAGTPEEVAKTKHSYTGKALKSVLSAGPIGDLTIGQAEAGGAVEMNVTYEAPTQAIDFGEDVKMPWDRDGRAWHTVNHVDHKGESVEWDADVLNWLVDTMESIGSFARTDWKHRTRIEIKAPGTVPWFCHIITGGSDLLEVAIRTPWNTFTPDSLAQKLKIKTLDERTDLPIYGQWDRLRHGKPSTGWEEWRLYLRDFKDVSKPAFRSFLSGAAKAYATKIADVRSDPAQAKPWTVDGQKWHLSQKALSVRHTARWKPTLLLALIGRFKAMQPDLSVDWNSQTAVQVSVPGEPHPAGKIVTNIGRGLRIELRAPSGTFTTTQIDQLGTDADIKRHPRYDRIVFWLRSLNENDSKQLLAVWQKCRTHNQKEQLQSA